MSGRRSVQCVIGCCRAVAAIAILLWSLLGRLSFVGRQARPRPPARAQAVIRGRLQTATALPHPTRAHHARQQLRIEGVSLVLCQWRAAQRRVASTLLASCALQELPPCTSQETAANSVSKEDPKCSSQPGCTRKRAATFL